MSNENYIKKTPSLTGRGQINLIDTITIYLSNSTAMPLQGDWLRPEDPEIAYVAGSMPMILPTVAFIVDDRDGVDPGASPRSTRADLDAAIRYALYTHDSQSDEDHAQIYKWSKGAAGAKWDRASFAYSRCLGNGILTPSGAIVVRHGWDRLGYMLWIADMCNEFDCLAISMQSPCNLHGLNRGLRFFDSDSRISTENQSILRVIPP